MSKRTFNTNQHTLIERSLREKIEAWTNEVNHLNQQIETAKEALETLKSLGGGRSGNGSSGLDARFQRVVEIFRDAKQSWIQAGYIREQYRIKAGEELPKSTLRHYLNGQGNIRFEKKGERRFTKWRLIDSSQSN